MAYKVEKEVDMSLKDTLSITLIPALQTRAPLHMEAF